MGCDIHGPFVEFREWVDNDGKDQWWPIATMDFDRDYGLFSVLANVRGTDAVVEPRGVPADVAWGWQEHNREWQLPDQSGTALAPDCHSHSWMNLGELKQAQAAYMEYGDRENSDLAAMIAMMEDIEARREKPTRAVFCFDN